MSLSFTCACVRASGLLLSPAIRPAKSGVFPPAALELWEFDHIQYSCKLNMQGGQNGLRHFRMSLRVTSLLWCWARERSIDLDQEHVKNYSKKFGWIYLLFALTS
jgi:hypothetical protein